MMREPDLGHSRWSNYILNDLTSHSVVTIFVVSRGSFPKRGKLSPWLFACTTVGSELEVIHCRRLMRVIRG